MPLTPARLTASSVLLAALGAACSGGDSQGEGGSGGLPTSSGGALPGLSASAGAAPSAVGGSQALAGAGSEPGSGGASSAGAGGTMGAAGGASVAGRSAGGGMAGVQGVAGSAGASGAAGSSPISSGGATESAGSGGVVVAGTGPTLSAGSGAGGSGGSGGSGEPGACEPGSTLTDWATGCRSTPHDCVPGSWSDGGPNPEQASFTRRAESEHFVVYSDDAAVTAAVAQNAADTLEHDVWQTYFGDPVYFPEPYCDSATKYKGVVHIHGDWGLTGGAWGNQMGMWIGVGGAADHWGLAHEFMHGVQSLAPGLKCGSRNTCGWIFESHANFMPHQLPEYRGNVHCSEMLVNAPHVYLGSTRDRYCDWQFMEYLKDRYCYQAVHDIWLASPAGADPFLNIAATRGWSQGELNDFFGDWAMHNVTWDYVNPPPTSQDEQGSVYREAYGALTSLSRPERHRRLTQLEALDDDWATNRRFMSPFHWAPQRWGYNIVELVAEAGANQVTVAFRGVEQPGANSGWRWGLVATDPELVSSRYSSLQRGSDGRVSLCIGAGERVWLVVVGAPTEHETIEWDQLYGQIYRYPYLVEVEGAWPRGFEGGQRSCAQGSPHANGGGCVVGDVPESVYVGPYAQVLGGSVSGNARIEDHAIVLDGSVTGGVVGALSTISNGFTVSDTAEVRATFYPLGHFASGQGASGAAVLYGDLEYQGAGLNKSSGSYSGFVDSTIESMGVEDINTPPPYAWR